MSQFNKMLIALQKADEAYYELSSPLMLDSDYDILWRTARDLNPTHTYFLGTGSKVRKEERVRLPYHMGSLNQVYEGELAGWVTNNGLVGRRLQVLDKLDGNSVLIIYDHKGDLQIALTKGDGKDGKDVTRHIRQISNVPKKVTGAMHVRAEVIITPENFVEVNAEVASRDGKPYKNCRNFASGVMNSESNPPVIYKHLDVVAYEILGLEADKDAQLDKLAAEGFSTAPSYVFINPTEEELENHLNDRKKLSKYELDGLVLEANDFTDRNRLKPASDTANPTYAVKFKVTSAGVITTVVDVEFNLSKDGFLIPRLVLEPIELQGVTITHATGFNAKFIKESKIGVGSTVLIERRGDVIPYVVGVITPTPDEDMDDWFKKKLSQHGAWEWTPTGVDAVLVDAVSNSLVRFKSLCDFFNSVDVPGLKEGNIQTLFSCGHNTPHAILCLPETTLCTLLGQAIGAKVYRGLRDKFTNIPVHVLMGAHPAFGRGVGERKMKKLCEAFNGDMSRCGYITDIMTVDGFDLKTAQKIVDGASAFLQFMKDAGASISVAPYVSKKVEGKMTGVSVCFTGFRSEELEAQIEAAGGKVASGVSKNTTVVVAADPTSSSGKAGRAHQLGIPVMTADEFVRKFL